MNRRAQLDALLDSYRRQVLRWNRQINLVSRRDSADKLQGLIHQCRGGWDRLAATGSADLASSSLLWYFDLGSGAGLPGFVWHAQAASAGLPIRTWLVEPREKRAWFLNRLNGLPGAEPVTVVAGRWGETELGAYMAGDGEPRPSHVLISLKALHLTDAQVLEGLAPLLARASADPDGTEGVKILIVRFYPPDQAWTEDLAADLGIPQAGEVRTFAGHEFQSGGGAALPAPSRRGAGLVLSEYLAPAT